MTQVDCGPTKPEFQDLARRRVKGRFDAGRTSSDGGLLLIRELDQRLGLIARFAKHFTDRRVQTLAEFSVGELLRQRIFAPIAGYEALSNHDALRDDSLLAVALGRRNPIGGGQTKRDRGKENAEGVNAAETHCRGK